MGLREEVEIWASDPEHHAFYGVLTVEHSLPVLGLIGLGDLFLVSELPDSWSLRPCKGQEPGDLLSAWWAIQQIQHDLAVAQRKAEEAHADVA